MFFDGPWNSGVLNGSFASVIDSIDVVRVPYPEATGGTSFTYRGPTAGTFWVSAQSQHVDLASDVLQQLTTEQYYVSLAEYGWTSRRSIFPRSKRPTFIGLSQRWCRAMAITCGSRPIR